MLQQQRRINTAQPAACKHACSLHVAVCMQLVNDRARRCS